MRIKEVIYLGFSIFICLGAGMIGSIYTSSSIDTWYATLEKPTFNPPSWLFAPVWTTLYFLMGISLFLISRHGLRKGGIKLAISIFGLQLVLNALWSFIFFGMQNPFLAFMEIIVLWIAILITIMAFYKIKKVASVLLVPYIIWVTIATILNYYIWRLNI